MSETTQPAAPAAGSSPVPAAASPTPTERPDVKSIVSRLTPEQRRQVMAGKPSTKAAVPSSTPATPAPAAAPTATPAATAPAAAPVSPAPGTEATPATPVAAAPSTPADSEAQPGETPAGDGGDEKSPSRFRFTSEQDKAVAQFAKANGISLVEASLRLYPQTATAPAAPAATPAAPAEPAPDPEIVRIDGEISAKEKLIADLTAQRKKAHEDLDSEKASELSDKIADAKADAKLLGYERKSLLQNREDTARATAQEQVNASRDRGYSEFPELANSESVHSLALNAFVNAAKSDPARAALFTTPNWPETLIREYAAKYGVKPKSAAGTAPAAAPAPAATPAPVVTKPAPTQVHATPTGARLLTSSDGQAPGAPKQPTEADARAAIRNNPKLGRQVFAELAKRKVTTS